jgi:hypothetical protein
MALDSEEGKQALLGRLGKEPFGRLAAELGATERELVDYLLSLGEDGEPDDQPWWPEALARLERSVPIRDVAWIFRQPSASIRRAIERAGLDTARVGADEIAVARSSTQPPVLELPALEPLVPPPADESVPPDADAPLDDPADRFGWISNPRHQ